jgi:hypothetical protein
VAGALPCALTQPITSGSTLYGVVDTAIAQTNAGKGSVSSLESGVMLGLRVGFRGEEVLAGDKALYTLEMGLNNDTGAFKGTGFRPASLCRPRPAVPRTLDARAPLFGAPHPLGHVHAGRVGLG